MPTSYDITRLPDGKYKISRLSDAGKPSRTLSFARLDLEIYLTSSVSKTRLEQALRILDGTGQVTVEADLEP